MEIFYPEERLSNIRVFKKDDDTYISFTRYKNLSALCTDRFWKSIWKLLKVNPGLFHYFSSDEIFRQLIEKNGDIAIRFCLEKEDENFKALACSQLERNLKPIDLIISELMALEPVESGYYEGNVFAIFSPSESVLNTKRSRRSLRDKISTSFPEEVFPSLLMFFPVDGAGEGSQTIGISSNFGSIFFDFKHLKMNTERQTFELEHFFSDRLIGKNKGLRVSLEQICQLRVSSAKESAASLKEIAKFFKLCDKYDLELERFDGMLNHPFEAYGLPSFNSMSMTRMGKLPTKVSVLELFEAMMAASSLLPMEGRWKLNQLAGEMIADYYDFEGIDYQSFVDKITGVKNDKKKKELEKSSSLKPLESFLPEKSEIKSYSDKETEKMVAETLALIKKAKK